MIRALVVEDSSTARELLVEILRSDSGVEVVGAALNGVEGVEMTKRLKPDIITMDVRMPVMDGFEATRVIMAETPTPIVIVTASCDVREIETSMNALRLGALTVVAKPTGPMDPDFDVQSERLLRTIKTMSQVRVVRRLLDRTPQSQPRVQPWPARGRIVAIAASTGGPAALARILGDLSMEFPVPVLVVQHIANGFVPGFVAWLNSISTLRVKVAEAGEPLLAKTVYIAPDDRHLAVADRSTISLSDSSPLGGFRPSGTVLFASVAKVFGNAAVAVVLTGMGQDGVAALSSVRAAGGVVIAQDEGSCVVFGMPGAAVSARQVDETLRLDAIASRLGELVAPAGGLP
jgi:two-component system, chemotaxis family, protein-glutamate methylesterase/glutaminase